MQIKDLEAKIYHESQLCYIIGDFFRKFVSGEKSYDYKVFAKIKDEFEYQFNKLRYLFSCCKCESEYENLLSAFENFYKVFLLEDYDYIKNKDGIKLDNNRKILAVSNVMYTECYKEVCANISTDLNKYMFQYKNISNKNIHKAGIYAISAIKSYLASKNIRYVAEALKDKILTEYPTAITGFMNILSSLGNLQVNSYSELDNVVAGAFGKREAQYINDCISNLGFDECVNDVHKKHVQTAFFDSLIGDDQLLSEKLHYDLYKFNEKIGLRIKDDAKRKTNNQVSKFIDDAKLLMRDFKDAMSILNDVLLEESGKIQTYDYTADIKTSSLDEIFKYELERRNEKRNMEVQVPKSKKEEKVEIDSEYIKPEKPVKEKRVREKKVKEKRVREKKVKEKRVRERMVRDYSENGGFEFRVELLVGLIFAGLCVAVVVLQANNLIEPILDFFSNLTNYVSKLFDINLAEWAMNLSEKFFHKAQFFDFILFTLPVLIFVLIMLVVELVWLIVDVILVVIAFVLMLIFSLIFNILPIIFAIIQIAVVIGKLDEDKPSLNKIVDVLLIVASVVCCVLFYIV